jgi:hypothetical protein
MSRRPAKAADSFPSADRAAVGSRKGAAAVKARANFVMQRTARVGGGIGAGGRAFGSCALPGDISRLGWYHCLSAGKHLALYLWAESCLQRGESLRAAARARRVPVSILSDYMKRVRKGGLVALLSLPSPGRRSHAARLSLSKREVSAIASLVGKGGVIGACRSYGASAACRPELAILLNQPRIPLSLRGAVKNALKGRNPLSLVSTPHRAHKNARATSANVGGKRPVGESKPENRKGPK